MDGHYITYVGLTIWIYRSIVIYLGVRTSRNPEVQLDDSHKHNTTFHHFDKSEVYVTCYLCDDELGS